MTFAVERYPAIPLRPEVDVVEQLLEASRARSVLDCRAGDARSIINADDVRRACLSSSAVGDPFGVRLANAAVAGTLDLRAATVPVPLHFAACTFARAPCLDGAELHELSITDGRHGGTAVEGVLASSRLPGLLANGVRIRRDLQLSGSVVTGAHATPASLSRTSAIWLTEAQIGGRLLAVGTRIEASGDRAIQCDRTRVAGDVRLIRGFTANREIRMLAVELGGSLDLMAATLSALDGRALDMAEATIGGSLFILEDQESAERPVIRGRLEMSRATIRGRMLIRNADLHAPSAGQGQHHYDLRERASRTFLLAPRLTVDGELVVEGETIIHGALRLPSAELRGVVRLSGVDLRNEHDLALDLSHARLGSALRLPDARVAGTLILANARIAGRIDLQGLQVTSPERRRCIVAIGITSSDVFLRKVTATGGTVNFRGATIRGNVDAQDATLTNPVGKTLSLKQARIAGNVRLCGKFFSTGVVVLSRAVIEGRLRCDGATMAWPRNASELAIGMPEDEVEPNVLGSAFEAISADIRSGVGLGWRVTSGGVDFSNARTSFLADDPAADWPEQSHLVGFTFERFAPLDMKSGRYVRDARIRRAWLERFPYDPQPWEQAARVLRANGDENGAEEILIAQRRRARRERIGLRERPLGYVWDAMKDRFVGYGYRPQRALFVLVGLIAVVAGLLMLPGPRMSMTAVQPVTVVSADGAVRTPSDHCLGGKARCFEPVLYAIDTVVPLIDLGQRSAWYPSGPDGRAMGGVLNLCTGIGWFFSTIAALSFARLARSS